MTTITGSSTRAAIRDALRRDEQAAVSALLAEARLEHAAEQATRDLARRLVLRLRARGTRGPVEGLMREYALSSAEGTALMCLAEALLRTPDTGTRDALIREGVASGDWRAHLGRSPSLFVNAASWGLLVTGRLQATATEEGLARALGNVFARGGQPVIRRALDLAMRLMGDHFVLGQTIEQALERAEGPEARGFRYSYDMLGEGALTADDAARYAAAYGHALDAIGGVAGRRGTDATARPGLSIKLSALHPRYVLNQRARVLDELVPRVGSLVRTAARLGVGINIDAEEADRLDLSLDVLEALCRDPSLGGRDTLGFVVQAYGKRASFVIDHLASLARATGRRIAVRLVKGAYWDSEIKRAQEAGLDGFPLFTRKVHTDVSYVACARRMLDAGQHLYPQFATHNARTLATIHTLAGAGAPRDAYEFQCLHGMGEALYEDVIAPAGLDRPCRIYAPVGTHETLLAYLVRRLLENGANTSFVNRINDPAISPEALIEDPASLIMAETDPGSSHPAIALPPRLFGDCRRNARGLDLADADTRTALLDAIEAADPRSAPDLVATTDPFARASAGAAAWRALGPEGRAAVLRRAADRFEEAIERFAGPLACEAGKTIPSAVAEIREAVDFLRYYANEAGALGDTASPLGTVVCISPWNFPVAIFSGQVAAALASGNAVIAKPAPETPDLAARAAALLHEAGVPADALILVPGDGEAGAALVRDPRVDGVLFTGSTATGRRIAESLALHAGPRGAPVPFVAETGGQNAMIVDSSALAEQVVTDVIASAFDSAGQRCSALRILCLQDDVADRILAMVKGAADELVVGDPARFDTDLGPVITNAAAGRIEAHLAALAGLGFAVHRCGRLSPGVPDPRLVRPAIVELDRLDRLGDEVFGPVLHVLRWRRGELDALLAELAATGYGLTVGVHTRLDETIARVERAQSAGNLYVNRNMIGAVVGVQPFGGHGLSGTGPKAGGPLLLRRLVHHPAPLAGDRWHGTVPDAAGRLVTALEAAGHPFAARARAIVAAAPVGARATLPGPVGERNEYRLESRGPILCRASTADGALACVAAVLATGNTLRPDGPFPCPEVARPFLGPGSDGVPELALFEGDADSLGVYARALAGRDGAIVTLLPVRDGVPPPLDLLCRERHTSTNTAAAGGNASLMAIG